MAFWELNTSGLWRRVGLREDQEPELIHAIQPVYTIGDGSQLVPPALAPQAFAGGFITVVGGEHGALAIQALAPGGCWVQELEVTPAAVSAWRFSFLAALPAAMTAVKPMRDNGPTPVLSRFLAEYIPVGSVELGNDHPAIILGSASTPLFIQAPFYIPSGVTFWLESSTVGPVAGFYTRAHIRDVPEQITPSATAAP